MSMITMSNIELDRYKIVERIIEKRLTAPEGAKMLSISERQMRRLVKACKEHGAQGLVSKKRGMKGNHAYPKLYKEYVLDIIRSDYGDFGPTLAAEKLSENHNCKIAKETMRKWMMDAGIWRTRKEKRKQVHQPRYRRECFGELIQIDGSDHYWFEDRGPRCTLLVYVDDATSAIVHLRFVKSESTFDYFVATREYLEKYGRPVAFYSDKHAIFRVNQKGATTGNGMTQFGRAMNDLNIEIICANTSQAKGRVERMNKTLQDRLVKEMRLQNICGIDAANAFIDRFIDSYNGKFAKPPRNEKNLHRPLDLERLDLDDVFAWQEERTVTNSLTVQYDRVVYLIEPNEFTKELCRKKVTVYDYCDGTISLRFQGRDLPYSTFDKVRQVKQADVVSNKRLGAVLALVQEQQKTKKVERSKSGPIRTGQTRTYRNTNPASEKPNLYTT